MFGYLGYKKRAFTLAEVLITLGIIGVVAAMTIPTLMANYQKNVWEAKLKKAYSVAANACDRMIVEESVSGADETAFYNASDASAKNAAIKRYIKIMKDGTVDETLGFSVTLPDGAVLYFKSSSNGFDIYTDVNGPATNPNTVGKDIFEFRLDKNCAYDSSLSTAPAQCFKQVVENDWKIPDNYAATTPEENVVRPQSSVDFEDEDGE